MEGEMILENTAKKPRLDTSVDTSATQAVMGNATTRAEHTIAVQTYGGRVLGAAGESVPEDPSATTSQMRESDISDAALGTVGPTDRLRGDGEEAGEDAALRAAHTAKCLGSSADAVLDALEAAEAEFEAANGRSGGDSLGEPQASRGGGAEVGPPPLSHAAPPQEHPASPRAALSGPRASLHLDDATRSKVRKRLFDALLRAQSKEGSCQPSAGDADEPRATAARLETDCYNSSTSRKPLGRSVYFSKAGNAARLASMPGAARAPSEIARTANGAAPAVASGSVAAATPSTGSRAGLQGIADKPH